MVENGDTVASIAETFGVDRRILLEANMLSRERYVPPYTPILAPLRTETHSVNPRLFFCDCSTNGHLANRSLEGSNCVPDRGKSLPLKLAI